MEGSLVADRLSRLGLSAGQSGAAADGGVLQLRENEELLGERASVGLSVGTESVGTQGKVSITSRRVVWVPDDPQSCSSCSVDLSHVVMHAQSSPAEGRPGGVYLQVEAKPQEGEEGDGEGAVETLELVLTHQDQSCLDELYGLLCDGVVMNPDEGFLDGEDGGWDGGPADFFVAGGPPRGDREGEPSQDENDRFADA